MVSVSDPVTPKKYRGIAYTDSPNHLKLSLKNNVFMATSTQWSRWHSEQHTKKNTLAKSVTVWQDDSKDSYTLGLYADSFHGQHPFLSEKLVCTRVIMKQNLTQQVSRNQTVQAVCKIVGVDKRCLYDRSIWHLCCQSNCQLTCLYRGGYEL